MITLQNEAITRLPEQKRSANEDCFVKKHYKSHQKRIYDIIANLFKICIANVKKMHSQYELLIHMYIHISMNNKLIFAAPVGKIRMHFLENS